MTENDVKRKKISINVWDENKKKKLIRKTLPRLANFFDDWWSPSKNSRKNL